MFLGYNFRIMLKLLAILAMVFAVAQASMPTTGQASNDNGNKGHQNRNEAATSQGQAKPISSVFPQPPEASHPETETASKSAANAQDSITIIESTPVPSKRDWFDISTLALGILLAIITGAGVIAAWFGLPELKRQAEAAKEAAIATKNAVTFPEIPQKDNCGPT